MVYLRVAAVVCLVIGSVSVGFTTAEDGAGTLIVLNKAEASASLIDAASGKEVAKLQTGVGPHEAAVSPDGRLAVVCNYGAQQPGSSLTLIDMIDRKVTGTIDLAPYRRPHGIMFFADGRRIAVTAEMERKLLIVDIAAGKVVQAVDTGAAVSHMVVLSPDGVHAWVSSIGSGSVTLIDVTAGANVAVIPTGAGAEGIDISPDGKEVWVGNRAADTVSVIDTASRKVVATLPSAKFPIRIKFTPDGARVLVSNAMSGEVAVFDRASRAEIARIAMNATAVEQTEGRMFADAGGNGPVPVGILIEPTGGRAYVANTNADIVTVIDLQKLAIAGRLTAGKEPDGMAWSPVKMR